ncbi:MAG: hypothetical protein ACREUF_03880, partial [Solimonas sp.]
MAIANAIAIAVGGIPVGFSDFSAKTSHQTDAYVNTQADLNIPGNALTLDAISHSTAKSGEVTIQLGGIPIAIAQPNAEAGGGTRVFVGEGAKIQAATLDATANATNTATATTLLANLGGIVVGAAAPTAKTTHKTEAFIGAKANDGPADVAPGEITLSGGDSIDFLAKSTNDASVAAVGVAIGAITVNVVLPKIEAGGSTAAHVGGKFTINRDVNATADSTNTATGNSIAVSVGAIPIGFSEANATNSHVTDAYVNTRSDLTFTGSDLALSAVSHNTAKSGEVAIQLGAISINVAKPHATAGGSTRAFIDQGANVAATSLTATSDSTSNALVKTLLVSLGAITVVSVSPTAETTHNT